MTHPRLKLAIAVIVLALIGLFVYSRFAKAAWLAGWDYRVKITVLAAEVDADLTAYPVYVDLNDLPAGFHTNVNQTDARDIRVTTSDGTTEVPREVVFYTAASDTGELHFKGNVDGDTDTDFYIYYGNASASDYAINDTYGAENVWNSSFVGVYHLNEAVNTDVGGYVDSTTNDNDGQGVSMALTAPAGKLSGLSAEFDGGADYISVPDSPTLDGLTTDIALEAWVYGDAMENTGILMKGPLTNSQGVFNVISATVAADWYVRLNGSVTEGAGQESGGTATTGAWHYIVGYRTGDAFKLRVDGVEIGSSSYGTAISTNNDALILGGYYSTGNLWNGKLDEIRISSSGYSTEWFDATFSNHNSPGTFYSVDTQESAPLANTAPPTVQIMTRISLPNGRMIIR